MTHDFSKDPDFQQWMKDCAKKADISPIDDDTLLTMFDDGLEPNDLSDPDVIKKYSLDGHRKVVPDNLKELFSGTQE